MTDWFERDSATYRDLAAVAVPRRDEMSRTLLSLVPFDAAASFRIVELGCGEGRLAELLLDRFPSATLLALDGSASMRALAAGRLDRFGARASVRAFDLASLDWWDLMAGAGLVVSSLCIHHLNEAKKQYLFKAVAGRLTRPGAFLVADIVDAVNGVARESAAADWDRSAEAQAAGEGKPELFGRFLSERWNCFRWPDPADRPSQLFHQLMWLKHAGFESVDCFWTFAGHAVFGGFR